MTLRGGRGRYEWERWCAVETVLDRARAGDAYGLYVTDGPATAFSSHGLIVLTLEGDRISAITRFVDNSVMEWFGLPQTLE
jgi:hypothetical protein